MEPRIRREIVLPEPAEEVWEALTDPERLEEWFANEVELDLEQGEGVFRWDDGSERRVSIEVVDPERRLGFTWTDEDGAETRVDFTLLPDEDGTRLVVVEQTAEWSTALELRALGVPRAPLAKEASPRAADSTYGYGRAPEGDASCRQRRQATAGAGSARL